MIIKTTIAVLLFCYQIPQKEMNFVEYLKARGYTSIEMESYKDVIKYVDSFHAFDDQIIYKEVDGIIFGFIFFKESERPYLFISNGKSLTYFLSEYSSINRSNVYKLTLNNLYSAYFVNFEDMTVSYIMFNYGLHHVKTIINVFKLEGGEYCKKSSVRSETIPYPQFSDTTQIRDNYNKFDHIDVNPKIKNLAYQDEKCPDSKIVSLFKDYLIDKK